MSLYQLLAGGIDRVVTLAKADQLEARYLWVAVKGAWKYARAVASGDVAGEDDARARVRSCDACSAADRVKTGKPGVVAVYCGRGELAADGPTCGCLVGISIGGMPLGAAGKTQVASESCPRGRWVAIPPDACRFR